MYIIIIIIILMHDCMVYTDHAEMATVSRGTSHATTKERCNKNKKSYNQSFRITCDKSAVSLLESGEQTALHRNDHDHPQERKEKTK